MQFIYKQETSRDKLDQRQVRDKLETGQIEGITSQRQVRYKLDTSQKQARDKLETSQRHGTDKLKTS